MRIAAYVRVSTERQAEQGTSIEEQKRQITAWATANQHTVVQGNPPGQ